MVDDRGSPLAPCAWPALAQPYDAALRDAVAFVLKEVDPVGIIATGTIVRGHHHAASDLDVYVIHRAPFRRRVQRYFNGVPAEILINTPRKTREYFDNERRDGRLITAHMLATGVVVLALDPVVEELRREARESLARPVALSEDDIVRARYHAATALEDGTDVAAADPRTATMLLSRAVSAMLELACRSHIGRVPRSKDLLAAVSAFDAELGALADAFFDATTVTGRQAAAERIADRTIGTRGFFEWDSGPEPIDPME